ncbi:seryl-tRNA synthetase [Schizopora paradoxa]|uniref:serine--tRNA ligase n=1 Tax=Schizopora paradoxa TaxID=27342 RepID=A0A0H2S8V5_9AGAM|nr:seryl-tRNA synthetase [Schizopora paradoxa]
MPVGAVQSVARLYGEWKDLTSKLNAQVHARSSIGDRIREGSGDAKTQAIEEAKVLKASISELQKRVTEIEDELHALALTIPNDTHHDTPIGPEDAAITLSTHGPEPCPPSPQRDHVNVAKSLNLLDLEAGSTITGSSWYYLLNEGALLELALTQYAMSKAIARGFKPITTPDVVRADIASRCGFQPRDSSDPPVHQMYHLQKAHPTQPELVLSGTAEIPLAGMFANKIFREEELPIKYVGLGRAFRSEAGARGADTRGLYRVHQFTKVELFAACAEGESDRMMQELFDLQLDIFGGLGLPIRALDMPTEELGASAFRKYDIEAWMPGRGRWGEISSTSNCTDYQSRRLHIRYRRRKSSESEAVPDGPLPFAHTLNGTAAAIPRLIVALLENGVKLSDTGEVVGLSLPVALKPFWISSGQGVDISWT